MKTNRRSFLKGTAALAGMPLILPSRVWSAPTGPNSQVAMGFIGTGGQGSGLLGAFLGHDTRVLAVCDVNAVRRGAAKKRVDEAYKNADCAACNDFREVIARKDIDAVCIATPDHWHAVTTLAALRAGKDVYCEKPLTHNIHEAVEVMKAVEANKRVLQTGSMQRSMKEFRIACELVQNGVIGKVSHVECAFGGPPKSSDSLPTEQTPAGLDWDLWCGPAPLRGYNKALCPFPNGYGSWRSFKEYGSGGVGDWGAHHLDIAQWGLGMDGSGPVEVLAAGGKSGCKLVYADGAYVEHKGGFGVHFYGANGEVLVNRGKFVLVVDGKVVAQSGKYDGPAKPEGGADTPKKPTSTEAEVQKAERAYLKDAKIRLYNSKNHIADFLECVRSRNKPVTSEIVGARSAICCHLMNQSYFHNAGFKWDPAACAFAGGTGDPQWLTRDYRSPWKV
ncbi:MAG: Gfo/Idh/MocA family oxidoreductase [bacterium]